MFAIACKIKHATLPLLHHRCIPKSTDEIIFKEAERPQCEWKCLSMESCLYVNMNPSNASCELGVGGCISVVPSAGYMVKVFTISSRICLLWSLEEQMGREPVKVNDGSQGLYVSRVHVDNALIIGKLVVGSDKFWANFEGRLSVASATGKVLTIDEACIWSWLLYTCGKALPVGAVIGGHLASGSPIYVAKRVDHQYGRLAFGYYSIECVLGNHELDGARTTTKMDILVMLSI